MSSCRHFHLHCFQCNPYCQWREMVLEQHQILVNKTCDVNRVPFLTISSILSYNLFYLAAWRDYIGWIAAACGVQAGRIRGSWEPWRKYVAAGLYYKTLTLLGSSCDVWKLKERRLGSLFRPFSDTQLAKPFSLNISSLRLLHWISEWMNVNTEIARE